MKTITAINEIEMYIFMLEDAKMKVYTDYSEIQQDLRSEFDLNVDISDIAKVYLPDINEEEEDLRIMYKNVR